MFSLFRLLPSLTGVSVGYQCARKGVTSLLEKDRMGGEERAVTGTTANVIMMLSLAGISWYASDASFLLQLSAELFAGTALGSILGTHDAMASVPAPTYG